MTVLVALLAALLQAAAAESLRPAAADPLRAAVANSRRPALADSASRPALPDSAPVPTPLSLGGDEVDELPVAPAAPESVFAADIPRDAGRAIQVRWSLSADDTAGARSVLGYEILRSASPGGPFSVAGSAPAGSTAFRDGGGRGREAPRNGTPYYYRIRSVGAEASSESAVSSAAIARGSLLTSQASVISFSVLGLAAIGFLVARGAVRRRV